LAASAQEGHTQKSPSKIAELRRIFFGDF